MTDQIKLFTEQKPKKITSEYLLNFFCLFVVGCFKCFDKKENHEKANIKLYL